MRVTTPQAIVLDTTPLGLLAQKKGVPEAEARRAWAGSLSRIGCLFFVPEIADYEAHREFVRQGNTAAVARLDRFNASVTGQYLPLTTPAVRLAADLWAQVQNRGTVTAPPEALDADALIAA